MPEISVIIPVFNGEKTLPKALESVLCQDYKDFEIIVVDDCSSDNSFSIAKEYAKKNKSITVIKNEQNFFVGYSRERALKEAAGKYVYFLDSDDVLFSENVFSSAMRLAYAIQKDGADIVVSSVRLNDKGEKIKKQITSAADILLFSPYLAQSFYKRSIIAFPFSFERKTAEDCEWLYYNLPRSEHIAIADIPFFIYTKGREGSLTTCMKKEYILPTINTFIRLYEDDGVFPERDRERVKRYCADALIEHAIRAKRAGDSAAVKKCVPYLKKSKAAPFMALSHIIGINAALNIINLKFGIK